VKPEGAHFDEDRPRPDDREIESIPP
jgi:hypothetical protein